MIIPNDWFNELFQTLEQYNFTIDENSSSDAEVSIDPEILGTIFENLLGEINPETKENARKSTGSFYTPRLIVDYMVEQSLTAYLQQQTAIDEQRILSLFTDKETVISDDKNIELNDGQIKYNNKEKTQLLNALFTLKILDPACGSGAFPVGLMQKMLFILRKLDSDGKWWQTQHIRTINSRSEEANKLKERLKNADADYIHKLGIISRCLYGVDIQPIATEIAKLRCFLSLIIDEKIDDNLENRGILPLPNLEFKFVTANTLLELPKIEKENEEFKIIKAIFDDIRSEYLTSYGKIKNNAKNKFNNLRYKYLNTNGQLFLSEQENKLFEKIHKWQPFSNESADWFDPKWMFGVEQFDIVIGNPPYIQLQKKEFISAEMQTIYQNEGYKTFNPTSAHQFLKVLPKNRLGFRQVKLRHYFCLSDVSFLSSSRMGF